jgi:excisionase family DNA binding protein
MDPQWLSVNEIATYLRVSRDTVYKWIAHKYLPAHKVGKFWRFRTAEVDDWIRTSCATDRSAEEELGELHPKDGGV